LLIAKLTDDFGVGGAVAILLSAAAPPPHAKKGLTQKFTAKTPSQADFI
jgi:hypothetical protein